MLLIFISIFSLCITHAMGAPHLKLGPSGYKMMSMSDQNSEDSLPLASKMILKGASRYNEISAPILEKATDFMDDNDESSLSLHPHKSHYDSHQSFPLTKSTSELQPNTIDDSKKSSSDKKPTIYLSLGIPKTSAQSANSGKEYPIVIPIPEKTNENSQIDDSHDDLDSSDESGDQEKSVDKYDRSKIIDKDVGSSREWIVNTTEKNKNDVTSPAMIESDSKATAVKDKLSTLMTEIDRAINSIDTKYDFRSSKDRIDSLNEKSDFAMVTHFPSIQILQQKNSSIRHKNPAMISPIFPSGFDILVGNPRKKPSFLTKEPRGRYFSTDHKNVKNKNKIQIGLENSKNRFSMDPKEFGKSYEDITGHGIPSVFMVNEINHDVPELKAESLMSLPVAMGPLDFQHLPLANHQPSQAMRHGLARLEMNSIPLLSSHSDHSFPTTDSFIVYPQEHSDKFTFAKSFELQKRRQPDNDFYQQYPDSRANDMFISAVTNGGLSGNLIGNTRSLSAEPNVRNLLPAKEILPPITESKSFVIDIVHEIATDDSTAAMIDDKKKEAIKGRREMQDAAQTRRTVLPNNGCKHAKSNAPPFYDFLAKFTNIMMGNALQYESNNLVASGASKIMEMAKRDKSS